MLGQRGWAVPGYNGFALAPSREGAAAMDEDPPPDPAKARPPPKPDKEARLAAALRANLRRRKAPPTGGAG